MNTVAPNETASRLKKKGAVQNLSQKDSHVIAIQRKIPTAN
jgi:hypothetical protein